MKSKKLNGVVFMFIMFLALLSVPTLKAEAKTIKSVPNGGYYIVFKKATISGNKLILKGTVRNWERSYTTKYYNKTGTFKLKLSGDLTIIDGYKPSYYISKNAFNSLCKKKDSSHRSLAFMITKKKVSMIRFW